MKYLKIVFIFIFTLIMFNVKSQDAIKNVFVEKYYISDINDETDTTGGIIEVGTTTYRVFVQLKSGCYLKSMYSDSEHQLKFSSTQPFYNNLDRGRTFATDLSKNDYGKSTTALDTWLTLGQLTKKSTITYFGIPKSLDNDGSFVGGSNNDGGSADISGGLLINDKDCVSLTISDGIIPMDTLPIKWFNNGFVDINGGDSTIFGQTNTSKEFISNTAFITNSGVKGNSDSNYILIGQFTTKGDFSFELNLEIYNPKPNGQNPSYQRYVSKNAKIENGEYRSPFLTYPMLCGCLDYNFEEYNDTIYGINCVDLCKTKRIIGCMDRNACNYDPNVNFNIPSLCCYPGYCSDRDISLVCPNLGYKHLKVEIYPNPSINEITLNVSNIENKECKYVIYNSNGKIYYQKNIGYLYSYFSEKIDITNLDNGVYILYLYIGDEITYKTFIKN